MLVNEVLNKHKDCNFLVINNQYGECILETDDLRNLNKDILNKEVEEYRSIKMSAKVYKKMVGSKRFLICISRDGTFFMVNAKTVTNSLSLENKIKFTVDTYSIVEGKIKELINSTIELSTL